MFCKAIFSQKNIQDSCREEKSQALKEKLVFLTHFDCLNVLPFQKRMHQIMTTCFHSVRQKLHRRSGTFDLLGFDFLIDEDFKVRYANHEKSKQHNYMAECRPVRRTITAGHCPPSSFFHNTEQGLTRKGQFLQLKCHFM